MKTLSIIVPSLTGEVPTLPKGVGIEVVIVKGVRPVSAARFEGLKRSTANYVWFVDADDEVDTSLDVSELGLDACPDMIRFKTTCGWSCIGDKIYRRDVIIAAFDEIGVLPYKHCEDGLMYLAALKHSKTVRDVNRTIYRYVNNINSTMHQFNPDVVNEREQFVDLVMKLGVHLDAPGYVLDRAILSRQSVVYVVTQLCRWPVSWKQIRQVCRELIVSRLVSDGSEVLADAPYAQKMFWAARHPWAIWIYRRMKGNSHVH